MGKKSPLECNEKMLHRGKPGSKYVDIFMKTDKSRVENGEREFIVGKFYYEKGEMELAMDDSWAMNLEQPKMAGRHRRTFTYGLSSDSRAKQLYDKLTPRDALAFDLYDTKRILLEDEVYDSYARMRIQGYIDDYTSDEDFQEIFDKKSKYNEKSTCKKKKG